MHSAFRHDGDTLSYTASRKLSAEQRDILKDEIIGLHADTINNACTPNAVRITGTYREKDTILHLAALRELVAGSLVFAADLKLREGQFGRRLVRPKHAPTWTGLLSNEDIVAALGGIDSIRTSEYYTNPTREVSDNTMWQLLDEIPTVEKDRLSRFCSEFFEPAVGLGMTDMVAIDTIHKETQSKHTSKPRIKERYVLRSSKVLRKVGQQAVKDTLTVVVDPYTGAVEAQTIISPSTTYGHLLQTNPDTITDRTVQACRQFGKIIRTDNDPFVILEQLET